MSDDEKYVTVKVNRFDYEYCQSVAAHAGVDVQEVVDVVFEAGTDSPAIDVNFPY